MYIYHKNRRTDFVTQNEKFYMYCPLNVVEKYLGESFYRYNKNGIVNLEKVVCIEDFELIFENGVRLPLSRREYVPTKQYYANFIIRNS